MCVCVYDMYVYIRGRARCGGSVDAATRTATALVGLLLYILFLVQVYT